MAGTPNSSTFMALMPLVSHAPAGWHVVRSQPRQACRRLESPASWDLSTLRPGSLPPRPNRLPRVSGRLFARSARRLRLLSVTGFPVSFRPRLAMFALLPTTTRAWPSLVQAAALDPVRGIMSTFGQGKKRMFRSEGTRYGACASHPPHRRDIDSGGWIRQCTGRLVGPPHVVTWAG
jgi:hypothetical protein